MTLKVIGDSWALDKLGYDYVKLDAFMAGLPRVTRPLQRNPWGRALLLALFSGRFDVVAVMHADGLSRRLVAVFGLLGLRKLVLFETIVRNVSGPSSLRLRLRLRLLGWLLRRSCRAMQVMVASDVETYHRVFGLPRDAITFVPWPMITGDNYSGEEPLPLAQRRIVLASGRANCDWETLLGAAQGQGWPLVIVCSSTDLPAIRANPLSEGVEILSEISRAEHERLVKSARLYVLCLGQTNIASGQIRLSHCSEFRTPLIASDVYGLRGYLEDGVNAVAVPPGDPLALRNAANGLLGNEARLAEIVAQSARFGEGKTVTRYARQLGGLIG